jgi:hypothetical protein
MKLMVRRQRPQSLNSVDAPRSQGRESTKMADSEKPAAPTASKPTARDAYLDKIAPNPKWHAA